MKVWPWAMPCIRHHLCMSGGVKNHLRTSSLSRVLPAGSRQAPSRLKQGGPPLHVWMRRQGLLTDHDWLSMCATSGLASAHHWLWRAGLLRRYKPRPPTPVSFPSAHTNTCQRTRQSSAKHRHTLEDIRLITLQSGHGQRCCKRRMSRRMTLRKSTRSGSAAALAPPLVPGTPKYSPTTTILS